MKSRLTILTVFACIMGIIAAVGVLRARSLQFVEQDDAHGAPSVAVIRLEKQPYTLTESFHGLMQPEARVELAFQIPGRLLRLGDQTGQRLREQDAVATGQVVARLEPDRYEAALRQTQARLQQAQAARTQVQAMLHDAEARLEDAQQELTRMQRLHAASASTQRELERAELAVRLANLAVEREQAQLAAADATLLAAQADEHTAQVNLSDTLLRAPRDGMLASVPVEVGQMLQPGQPVMSLVDLSRMKLVVGVVEQKLPLLAVGQAVDVQVRALGRHAELMGTRQASQRTGQVTIVPPAADPVTGLFNVEIEVPNEDGLLRPGMVARAMVQVMQTEVYAIPAEAVTPMGDRQAAAYFVEQASESRARRIIFQPLRLTGDRYLVMHLPGTSRTVVVQGQNRLDDGQVVHVLDSLPLAAGSQDEAAL